MSKKTNVCKIQALSALPALVMFSVGLFTYFLRSTDYLSAVPGDLGDARFNSVVLEHFYQWITGTANLLWSPRFYYPAPNVLGFSDAHFGTAAIYALLRWLGLSREMAFIGWYGIGCGLNFVVAYFSLRWLGVKHAGSAIGAFVFAFGLPALAQEGHAQLNYRFCIPVTATAFYKSIEDNRPRLWVLIIPLVVWQFFISIYLGLFLVYLLGATILSFIFLRRNCLYRVINGIKVELSKTRQFERWGFGLVIVTSSLSLIALLLKYRVVADYYGLLHGGTEDMATMLPRPQSYLLSLAGSADWMSRFLPVVPMRHEHILFIGFVALTLLVVGFFRIGEKSQHMPVARISALSLAILIIGTLSIGGYSLYFLVAKLPGFGSVRAPSRLILVMLWPIAVIVALVVQGLINKLQTKNSLIGIFTFLTIAVLLGLETWSSPAYSVPIERWHDRQAELERLWTVRNPPQTAVLAVSGRREEPHYLVELDAMIFAQDHSVATTNGYSGYGPGDYIALDRCTALATLVERYASGDHDGRLADKLEHIRQSGVRLALEPCPIPINDKPAQQVTALEAGALKLDLVELRRSADSVEFSVVITNTCSTVIDTQSGRGHPINLAWRFNPTQDVNNSSTVWQYRKWLGFSLAPGEAQHVFASGPIPRGTVSGFLQVTLVQEDVFWLHDLGMRIASRVMPTR